MSAHTVEVRNLGKRYVLGNRVYGYDTLREAVARGIPGRRRETAEERELWALRELDLDVSHGEVVGLVGPERRREDHAAEDPLPDHHADEGWRVRRGRLGALLEVGTGFHPELTGRENVFLDGAVLGMSRRDIARRFDEIVAFAGVERFLDTPLKRYSTGCTCAWPSRSRRISSPTSSRSTRCSRSATPSSRRSCLGKMNDFRQEGRTVLFVSHDLGAVGRLCNRGVWLDRGRVAADGPIDDVIRSYLGGTAGRPASTTFDDLAAGPIRLNAVDVVAAGREDSEMIRRDETVRITLRFETTATVRGLNLAVFVVARDGTRLLDDALGDAPRRPADLSPGGHVATVTLPPFSPPASMRSVCGSDPRTRSSWSARS